MTLDVRWPIPAEKLNLLTQWYARRSIGNSTLRGYPTDTKTVAQHFLAKIKLDERNFQPGAYRQYLDGLTPQLQAEFNANANLGCAVYFGAARKSLNIYFRELLYSIHFNRLVAPAWSVLEIPLDKNVARWLTSANPRLPRWTTIKQLNPKIYELFQDTARRVADSRKVAVIDLDVEYW